MSTCLVNASIGKKICQVAPSMQQTDRNGAPLKATPLANGSAWSDQPHLRTATTRPSESSAIISRALTSQENVGNTLSFRSLAICLDVSKDPSWSPKFGRIYVLELATSSMFSLARPLESPSKPCSKSLNTIIFAASWWNFRYYVHGYCNI
jgi:hypothetical protein